MTENNTKDKTELKTKEKKSLVIKKTDVDIKKIKHNELQAYGTGRRKSSVARVWIKLGNGSIVINNKPMDAYLSREFYKNTILRPFTVTNTTGQYDVICTVKGGGTSGQVGAILHGTARALDSIAPELHQSLHKHSLLTRDSRIVERKKYGKHKARKSTQFSKR